MTTYNKENLPKPSIAPRKRVEFAIVSPFKEEDVHEADEVTAEVKIPQMRTNEKFMRNKSLRFSDRVPSTNPYVVSKELTREVNELAGTILQTWNKYLEFVVTSPQEVERSLRDEYEFRLGEVFDYFVIASDKQAHKADCPHAEQYLRLRNEGHCRLAPVLPIQDQTLFGDTEKIPLTFEDFSDFGDPETEAAAKRQARTGSHLFVFVHGFQGTSFDMRLVKDQLALQYPKSHFLCAISNERNTDEEIEVMGVRLAEEVRTYVKKWFPNPDFLGRISFLSHSLGGVITRAAITHLGEYKDKMYTMVTFSSPHLGYMFSASKLVNAGLWFLKKWYKSSCLEQLSYSDTADIKNSYLYKLAMAPVSYPKTKRPNRGSNGSRT